MKQFKLGPCKARGGTTATIFEISDKIYGKFRGEAYDWDLNGVHISSTNHDWDLMPNNLPETITIKNVKWHRDDDGYVYPVDSIESDHDWSSLVGKKYNMTLTEVEE